MSSDVVRAFDCDKAIDDAAVDTVVFGAAEKGTCGTCTESGVTGVLAERRGELIRCAPIVADTGVVGGVVPRSESVGTKSGVASSRVV